jgi:uncharacterized membrane protein YhiD involved in acid resistance
MFSFAQIGEVLHNELANSVGYAVVRLVIAAILGGVIGAEREYKHRRAVLRTNIQSTLPSSVASLGPLERE